MAIIFGVFASIQTDTTLIMDNIPPLKENELLLQAQPSTKSVNLVKEDQWSEFSPWSEHSTTQKVIEIGLAIIVVSIIVGTIFIRSIGFG